MSIRISVCTVLIITSRVTQVLNETAAVCIGKWNMKPKEVKRYIELLISKCEVEDYLPSTAISAFDLLEQYSFSWWDSLIVASALKSECSMLYTEDMQDGLVVNKSLTINNPFT